MVRPNRQQGAAEIFIRLPPFKEIGCVRGVATGHCLCVDALGWVYRGEVARTVTQVQP